MRRRPLLVTLLLLAVCSGCGTTKWTDTTRTATEQLLLSDAIDRSVSQLDLRALAGKTIYIDTKPLANVTDKDYLVSTIRQHVLASGGILREKLEDSEYVLEVRAGAVGTNHHDVLFGIPATTLPATGYLTAVPSTIPELPLVKKTEQLAVAKVYVFAYNRVTGRPVWQSGAVPGESKAKDVWVFGAGPFESGTIHKGTQFLGDRLKIPLIDLNEKHEGAVVSIADEAYFAEPAGHPEKEIARQPTSPLSQVEPAKAGGSTGGSASAAPLPGSVIQTGLLAAPADGSPPAPNPPAASGASSAELTTPSYGGSPIPVPVTDAAPAFGQPSAGASEPVRSVLPTIGGRSTVVPLPPVAPAPEGQLQESMLGRLLHLPQ